MLFEMAAARGRGDSCRGRRRGAATPSNCLDGLRARLVPAGRHFRRGRRCQPGRRAGVVRRVRSRPSGTCPHGAGALELGLPLPNLNALGHRAVVEALQGRCRLAQRPAADRRSRSSSVVAGPSEPQALATFLTLGLVRSGQAPSGCCGSAHQPRTVRQRRADRPGQPAGAGHRRGSAGGERGEARGAGRRRQAAGGAGAHTGTRRICWSAGARSAGAEASAVGGGRAEAVERIFPGPGAMPVSRRHGSGWCWPGRDSSPERIAPRSS